jgi:glycosyltransferase involved in cell wall biosynthesis
MDPSVKLNRPITVLYLIDTSISAPGGALRGGTEKQLCLLVCSLNQEKFRPIVVQLSSDSSPTVTTSEIVNLEILRFPTQRLYDLSGFRQIARLLLLVKKRKVDIIHTFFEKSEVMGWVAARLSGIPVWITSRRDLGFKRKGIYDKIFRLTSKDCKKCIANCNAIKERVIQRENLPLEKIEVIYNGLNLSEYQETLKTEPLREELGIVNGAPLVGLIANFNFEIKGHIYFLGAAKKIPIKILYKLELTPAAV